MPTDSCGEIDISELCHRLADPKAKRCFINAGIARRFGFFKAAAALDDTRDSPRLIRS